MEKQRVNMDINKELWKKVGIRAIELNLQKKEIVELALKKFLQEGNKMAKVFYEDILVGEVLTNRSLTVEEALEAIGFDEAKFIEEQGFDDIDPNGFRVEY